VDPKTDDMSQALQIGIGPVLAIIKAKVPIPDWIWALLSVALSWGGITRDNPYLLSAAAATATLVTPDIAKTLGIDVTGGMSTLSTSTGAHMDASTQESIAEAMRNALTADMGTSQLFASLDDARSQSRPLTSRIPFRTSGGVTVYR